MSIDEKTNNIIKGFSSKVLLAKGIPELYEILKSKIDQISEEIGFKEIGISVCVDKDQNLVAAKPDLSNVDSMRRVYLNYFSKGVMEELIDKPIDPKPILEKEFIIPFQTNEIFEMPRSETKIKKLEEQGILPKNIWKSLEDDYYDTYRPRLLKSGKEPASFEMYRGGLLVPLLIDKNFNYGQIGFSVFNQDPNKYPDLARLTLEDDIPDKYKDMIKEITSEFSPIIFNILKLHKEHKLRTAAEQAKKETEEKNEELKQAYADLEAEQSARIKAEKFKKAAEMSATLSHYLKNIGRGVETNVDIIGMCLSDTMDEEDLEDSREAIANAKKGLADLVDVSNNFENLVGKAYKNGSSVGLNLESISVEEHLSSYLDVSFMQRFKNEGIRLEKNFEYSGDIKYDKKEMQKVYDNIFTNILEAIQKKKAFCNETNMDYEPSIDVVLTEEDDKPVLKIKDNGIGMPEEVLKKIQAGDSPTSKGNKPMGWGIITIGSILNDHKFQYFIESKDKEYTLQKIFFSYEK